MSKQLEALNGLFQSFQEQMAEDVNQAENARENGRTTLEQLGYMRLNAMSRFIEVIVATVTGLLQLKASLENDRDKLLQEIREHFGEPEPSAESSGDAEVKAPAPPAQPAEPLADAASDPKPRRIRKTREKAKPEYKRLPKHRTTGNPRLDALETALHDALECLGNTRLAFYVRDINEVRLALIELYKSWDNPEDERLAELESGLKTAADKLSANSRAAKSKIMQDIWSGIIVALQNKEDNDK
ncbi:MAG: hypothetical protein WC082_08025 [Victivallales bacterium]